VGDRLGDVDVVPRRAGQADLQVVGDGRDPVDPFGRAPEVHEPAMTGDERAALQRSAAALRGAAGRVLGTGP
jgi:hypothetical protein